MKRLLLAFALLACWLAIPASAQQFRTSTVDPVGNCTTDVVYNTSNGKMWGCNATGTFSQVNAGGGGSGTGCTGTSPCTFPVPIAAPSVATGSSAPVVTPGTGGMLACAEGTAPSAGIPAAGVDGLYCDSATHKILFSFNGSAFANPFGGAGCMASTTQTVSVAASTITFSSIPATCTGLRITLAARCAAASSFGDLRVQLNGDTTTGDYYGQNNIFSNITPFGGTQTGTSTGALLGAVACNSATAGLVGAVEIVIPVYQGTTFGKAMFSNFYAPNNGTSTSFSGTYAFNWNPATPATITQIVLTSSGGNFMVGSVATLQGF